MPACCYDKEFSPKKWDFLIKKKKKKKQWVHFKIITSFLSSARDRKSFLSLPCGNTVGDPGVQTHEITGSSPQDYVTHEFLTYMLVHIQPSMIHKIQVLPPAYGSSGFGSSKLVLSGVDLPVFPDISFILCPVTSILC